MSTPFWNSNFKPRYLPIMTLSEHSKKWRWMFSSWVMEVAFWQSGGAVWLTLHMAASLFPCLVFHYSFYSAFSLSQGDFQLGWELSLKAQVGYLLVFCSLLATLLNEWNEKWAETDSSLIIYQQLCGHWYYGDRHFWFNGFSNKASCRRKKKSSAANLSSD